MENCHFSSGIDPDLVCDKYRYSQFDSTTDARRIFYLHWHEYYEIEFCVCGKAENTINGEVFEISRGILSMLKPGDFHKIVIENQEALKYRKLSFLPLVMSDEFGALIGRLAQPLIMLFSGPEFALINSEFDRLENIENAVSGDEKLLKQLRRNAAETILLHIAQRAQNDGRLLEHPVSNNNLDPIMIAMSYIMSHISDRLTLDEIAAQSCLNPSYFSRLFHRRTSMTLSQYIIECRMRMAAIMLREKSASVEDIARRTGYRSLSLFYSQFNEFYGVTPGKLFIEPD